jgi:hypothetical protein
LFRANRVIFADGIGITVIYPLVWGAEVIIRGIDTPVDRIAGVNGTVDSVVTEAILRVMDTLSGHRIAGVNGTVNFVVAVIV